MNEENGPLHGEAHSDHEAPFTAIVIVPPIPTWPRGDAGDVSVAPDPHLEVSRVVIVDGAQERLVLVVRLVTETMAGVAVLALAVGLLSAEDVPGIPVESGGVSGAAGFEWWT